MKNLIRFYQCKSLQLVPSQATQKKNNFMRLNFKKKTLYVLKKPMSTYVCADQSATSFSLNSIGG